MSTVELQSNPMVPHPARVLSRSHEFADTITLELVPVEGESWPKFRCGQFTMLWVPGIGEIPISNSGDPEDESKVVHTIREVGAVSRALCALQPGDTVGLRGPFGTPWPIEKAHARNLIVVAGGLGLAPLRPLLYHVLHHREDFGQLSIFYGARSPEDILFRREVESWSAHLDIDVYVTVDHARADWRGRVGFVTRIIETAAIDPPNSHAFVCGPEIMMRLCAHELTQRGCDPDDIFVSMERNMKCAIGFCGHCQLGPDFICKDGPVLSLSRVAPRWETEEL